MAAVTGDARVTALERVSRAAVVEARPLDPLPPRGRVTARAGRSQPGSVHVLVAAHALSARDPLEPHVEHRGARGVRGALAVALPARHGGVLAGQRPGGLRVVEAGSGLPGDLAVAGGAVPSRELSPVLVGVAGRARGREAEVGPGVIDPLGGEGLPLVEESWQGLQSRYYGRACSPCPAAMRAASARWQARHFSGARPRPRSWHFVQLVLPSTEAWARLSLPGEICAMTDAGQSRSPATSAGQRAARFAA